MIRKPYCLLYIYNMVTQFKFRIVQIAAVRINTIVTLVPKVARVMLIVMTAAQSKGDTSLKGSCPLW